MATIGFPSTGKGPCKVSLQLCLQLTYKCQILNVFSVVWGTNTPVKNGAYIQEFIMSLNSLEYS